MKLQMERKKNQNHKNVIYNQLKIEQNVVFYGYFP